MESYPLEHKDSEPLSARPALGHSALGYSALGHSALGREASGMGAAGRGGKYVEDNRALPAAAASRGPVSSILQRKPNRTGLPDTLKSGIENLSGQSMDEVRVHYGSGEPAKVEAHAFAKGKDIHLAPGQERHLGHEAWHVAQQAKGLVKPTMRLSNGASVNDHPDLEKEADVMGAKAAGFVLQPKAAAVSLGPMANKVMQRVTIKDLTERNHRIFFHTVTGPRTPEEVQELIRQIIQVAPRFSGQNNLPEMIKAMSKAEFLNFRDSVKAGEKAHTSMPTPGLKGVAPTSKGAAPLSKGPASVSKGPGSVSKGPASVSKGPGSVSKGPMGMSKAPAPDKKMVSASASAGSKPVAPPGSLPSVASKGGLKPPPGALHAKATAASSTASTISKPKAIPAGISKGRWAPGGQIDRLITHGVQSMGILPWTHNTSINGLLGILTTGQFLSTVEPNVNFRYDLDSRYHEGVTLVMSPMLEWCWPGTHVQDLYKQRERLGKDPVSADLGRRIDTKQKGKPAEVDHQSDRFIKIREHLAEITSQSDFRDTQMEKIGKPLKAFNPQGPNPQYNLSLVNPQLRIPVEQPIGWSHINFIIVTKDVDDKLAEMERERVSKAKDSSAKPSAAAKESELDTMGNNIRKFVSRQKVKHNTKLNTNVAIGMERLLKLREQGRVKVVDKSGFSHGAGRMTGRKDKGEKTMESAASQGLEHGSPFEPEINNSQGALDMDTFLAFQQAYYEELAAAHDFWPSKAFAQGILDKRAKRKDKKGDEDAASGEGEHKGGEGDARIDLGDFDLRAPEYDQQGREIKAELPGTQHGDRHLTSYETSADGSCGIHAMTGALNEHGIVKDPNAASARHQIAERIKAGDVNTNEYRVMLKELMERIIELTMSQQALTRDEALLYDEFEKIRGFVHELGMIKLEAKRGLGILTGMKAEHFQSVAAKIRNAADHHLDGLRNYLITEIERSNAEDQKDEKEQLLRGHDIQAKRAILTGFSARFLAGYLQNCNQEQVRALLSEEDAQQNEGISITSRANEANEERRLREFHGTYFRAMMNAYANVVENGDYYLRHEDLGVYAHIIHQNLHIYRQEGQSYARHVHYQVPQAQGDVHIYHQEAHYEQAELSNGPVPRYADQ